MSFVSFLAQKFIARETLNIFKTSKNSVEELNEITQKIEEEAAVYELRCHKIMKGRGRTKLIGLANDWIDALKPEAKK